MIRKIRKQQQKYTKKKSKQNPGYLLSIRGYSFYK
jgi:hypothetical protein